MAKHPLTAAQRRVLERAATRTRGQVCPTIGIHAAAQSSVLRALRDRGLITDEPAPAITDAGRAILAKASA